MIIGGLQKTTLIDYPGKLACTVFLSGCNFRCPWCYSSELVLPAKIIKQPRIEEKYFFEFLRERKGLLEGVTICGGEPTINKDLPKFIEKIKNLGYAVKLDTNGTNPKMLKDIETSVEILKKKPESSEFRTTIVPGVHEKEDFLEIAKCIGGPEVKYYLQGFRPEKTIDPDFEKINPYAGDWLKSVAEKISPYFKLCQVR